MELLYLPDLFLDQLAVIIHVAHNDMDKERRSLNESSGYFYKVGEIYQCITIRLYPENKRRWY